MMTKEDITLYPCAEDVFTDPTLAIYFRPLITVTVPINKKPYKIHLFSTDGLVFREGISFDFSTDCILSFRYNHGIYEFLGNLEVLIYSTHIMALHQLLNHDFMEKREEYIEQEKTVKEYLSDIRSSLLTVSGYDNLDYALHYANAFYSYEFTKYYYQKYGVHQHISVVTEGWTKNRDPFLLETQDGRDVLEEFLIGLTGDVSNDYGLTAEMFIAGTECRRFVSRSGCVVMAAVKPKEDIVYMMEYSF